MLLGAAAAALTALVAVRAIGGERGSVLALLVGALPLVLLLTYPLLVAALAVRSKALVGACAGLAAAHVLVVLPALSAAPLPEDAAQAARLRVVVANLYVRNPDPEQAGAALRALQPDVLVVPEVDARGLAGLRASGLLADLPHTVTREDVGQETVGLFSRTPLQDVAVRRIGGRALPRATVQVDRTPVRLLAAHPLPPIGGLREAVARLAAGPRRRGRRRAAAGGGGR